jgi:hypothetical protein
MIRARCLLRFWLMAVLADGVLAGGVNRD